jgi:peptide/nickel transport system substrate-binding protein
LREVQSKNARPQALNWRLDIDGNSIAGRIASSIDKGTGKAVDGAIQVADNQTVQLNLRIPDITQTPGMDNYPAPPPHADHSYETAQANPFGTSPYKFESMPAVSIPIHWYSLLDTPHLFAAAGLLRRDVQ